MKRIVILILISFLLKPMILRAQQTQPKFIESSDRVIPWNIVPGENWPKQTWIGENWPEKKVSEEDLPEEETEQPRQEYNVNINIYKQPDKSTYGTRHHFFSHRKHQSRKSSKNKASHQSKMPIRKHRRVSKNRKQHRKMPQNRINSKKKSFNSVFSNHFRE